jgi:hypothetical protein
MSRSWPALFNSASVRGSVCQYLFSMVLVSTCLQQRFLVLVCMSVRQNAFATVFVSTCSWECLLVLARDSVLSVFGRTHFMPIFGGCSEDVRKTLTCFDYAESGFRREHPIEAQAFDTEQSDHMTLLQAFTGWTDSRASGRGVCVATPPSGSTLFSTVAHCVHCACNSSSLCLQQQCTVLATAVHCACTSSALCLQQRFTVLAPAVHSCLQQQHRLGPRCSQ